MSRKRIKCHTNRKKKLKGDGVSMKHITEMPLQMKRAMKKEGDNAEIVTLITEEKLDLEQIHNYKYMQSVAKDLNWSVGRLQKATDRVTKLLKSEEKEKDNE